MTTEQNPTPPTRCAVIANKKLPSVSGFRQISAVLHFESCILDFCHKGGGPAFGFRGSRALSVQQIAQE